MQSHGLSSIRRPHRNTGRAGRLNALWIAVAVIVGLAIVGGACILFQAASVVVVTSGELEEAREAGIRTEMEALVVAFLEYKMTYGDLPPSDPQLAARHVRRAFPHCQEQPAEFDDNSKALVFWLIRVSSNPANPFSDPNRIPLFEFDPQRLDATAQVYCPPASESPYVYRLNDGEFEIQWAGQDGQPDTEDDLVVTGR